MPKHLKKSPKGMKDRGYNRDLQQCSVKRKELRQAYQKTRDANGHSGSKPQTCRFHDELHAILGGAATTTPTLCFDSVQGVGGNTEAGFGGEEDEEEEVVDSSQQGSGETDFPNSQDLFITLDLDPVPPEPTPAENVSTLTLSSPSQRLAKIRRRKKRTRDEMFSELMQSSHMERSQQNAWRQAMSESRKAQYEREDKWRVEDDRWCQLADRIPV
ncbi:hypothetical protein UY3_11095 [Chelonia mydas]|uniref:Myb/SANT-like DNA-binding domain-containing protein n=1 Tax=Chelonia mydas TaxID=8469 RepID=M7B3X8_CHEMY|nr:hypothetical protein UY3_11095 [Chelonia mydas]